MKKAEMRWEESFYGGEGREERSLSERWRRRGVNKWNERVMEMRKKARSD